MRAIVVFWLVCGIGILAGCSDRNGLSADTPVARTAVAPKVEPAISVAPLLRDRLPADTALYARIPSLWGVYAAPNGRALDVAYLHPQHVAAIESVRKALLAEPALGEGSAIIARLLLAHWSGPLEIAVRAPARNLGPDSQILVSLPLSGLADASALGKVLVTAGGPPLQFDGDGYTSAPNAAAHFDAGKQQLLLLLGEGVTLDALKAAEASLKPAAPVFAESEARIDQSGQGLYLWLDLTALRSMLSMAAMQAGEGAAIINRFAAEAKSAALGFGSVDGKGRLAFEIEAPNASLLRYLPREAKQFAVSSVGLPSYAGSASVLLSPAEFGQLREAIAADAGAEAAGEFDEGLDKFKQQLGFALTDVLAALGPDLLFFNDAAGDFVALKVRDRKLWDSLLATLDALAPVNLVRNGDIRLLELGDSDLASTSTGLTSLFLRLRTRMFWLDEGDYLVFASTPQALRDRQAGKPAFALDAWLNAERGPQAGQSLLMIAGQTRHVARSTYYGGLGLLQMVADFSGAKVDPFGFASANELKLPVDGAAGIGIEVSGDRLAFVLSYDATGLDLIGGAGGSGNTMTVIAVIGILAAIAVPAYQDYVARAQVHEGLAMAGAAKTYLSEFYSATGKVPQSLDEIGADGEGRYSTLTWSDGMLLIEFHSHAPTNSRIQGQRIALALKKDGDWVCGNAGYAVDAEELVGANPADATTLPAKLQPSFCQ